MDLIDRLQAFLPAERILAKLIDRISFAPDAGFYYLVPQAVVLPVNETEIVSLFRFSKQENIPLVFRAGGTSLSGQSITDGILVDLSRFWNRITIENEGNLVRVQPGITGAMVNAYLRKFNRKIGPDPSSISAAMMGGILSNNASGMCCGVQFNSYHTTRFIRFILPGGETFTTEQPRDYERFASECAGLAGELTAMRQAILQDKVLYAKIREKYISKNTVGYSLNALIDYEHPLDMFAHLLIGAEGTLAFIAEAVMETIPELPCKATALLYFPDIRSACNAIMLLKKANAAMVEIMDRASLRSVENIEGMDPLIKSLAPAAAALLVEFQESSYPLLESATNEFLKEAMVLQLLNPVEFTSDPVKREFLWKVRKGLFPSVGAVRKSGTTVILEDLSFPVEKLGDAIADLQKLFHTYAYHNGIIFGHAKDGNIHFVITQSFDRPEEISRYDRFIQDVVKMVTQKYNGSLKAEHGTGRNMAPFVETEWGGEAYRIMQRIKSAADPAGLLNPGVIINADKQVHIKNMKALPAVETEVDKCIECGYCEHKCPSRDLTLTPRRRIVVRRALAQMKESGADRDYRLLLKQYQYQGLDTCAVDGLCAEACPVDINTGDLVKRLRKEKHSVIANRIALMTAKRFGLAEWIVRKLLRTGIAVNRLTGKNTLLRVTTTIRKFIPSFPLWSNQIVVPKKKKLMQDHAAGTEPGRTIVYFPTCISRNLGGSVEGKPDLRETFQRVSKKAGIHVIVVNRSFALCCGQIFSSKGYYEAYCYMAATVIDRLWESSCEGKYPVVTDMTSCTHTLKSLRSVLGPAGQQRFDQLTILDSIDFLHDMILPVCPPPSKKQHIVLHPVCSLKKTGTEDKFKRVAAFFALQVTVPLQAGCCGMAGDRGFLFPELTASATFFEAAEVRSSEYDGYYCSAKTCEMAMAEAVNRNYESILYLADESME